MFLESLLPTLMLAGSWTSWAQDPQTFVIQAKYQRNVDRGLQWLAKQQRNGRWEGENGQYAIPVTALAGMALLAEGSGPGQGKYGKQIDRAVEFLTEQAQPNGLIGDPRDDRERHRYMYGHAFAMKFLAQVYPKEKSKKFKAEIEQVLKRAVDFSVQAQTRSGGWGYVSAKDGNDFTENSVTVTQLHALHVVKNAGIPVPKETIDKAHEYLRKASALVSGGGNADPKKRVMGVVYSTTPSPGPVRAPITAGAVTCFLLAREDAAQVVQWLNYCQASLKNFIRPGHDIVPYTRYFYEQAVHRLGEDGHAKLRPDLAEVEKGDKKKRVLLKWSRHREVVFEELVSAQKEDGSWSDAPIGSAYSTAVYLIILQLDKGHLPMCRR